MNKSKWYSKLVNLAVVFALVVSAGIVVALQPPGPVLAQVPYSQLTLNITAPAANTTICVCTHFVVEFTITNTGNNTCTAQNIGVRTPDIWPIGAVEVVDSSGSFPEYLAVGENVTGWIEFHCLKGGPMTIHLIPSGWDMCRDVELSGDYALSDIIRVFQIERAKLLVTLDAPPEVCVSNNFTATVTVKNTGDAVAENVTPILSVGEGATITGYPAVPVNINADATASFEWTLHCDAPGDVGISVNVTGIDSCSGEAIPEGDITPAEPVTVVQQKAHLFANLTAPEEVCVSDNFTATVTVTNTGNVVANNVTPSLDVGTGASITGTPIFPVDILPAQAVSFVWTLHCDDPGVVQICANVTGIDGCTAEDIPEDNIDQPGCVNVTQRKAHLAVTLGVNPTELCVSDNFTATVTVTNTGNVEALNVIPSLTINPSDEASITVPPDPIFANIGVNGTASFNWTLRCDAFGVVQIGVNVTGQMAGACKGKDIPRANIILPAAINVTQQKVHLAVNFTAETPVCVSDDFTATVTVKNEGNVKALNVTPSLSVGEGAHILLDSLGPVDISVNETASFNYTLHCDDFGVVQICLNVTGQMDGTCEGRDIPADNIVGAHACLNVTQQKVHLETGLEIDPTELCISQNFTAKVTVKNTGNVEALNVIPVLTYNPATGANCTALTPASSNITPGGTVTFNSTCHCEEGGLLTVSLNVTGQMAGACNGTDIPVNNIILPAAVNVTQYPPLIIECDHEPEPGNVCNPVYFSVNATGGAGNYSWLWDFDDMHSAPEDNTSTEQNPTHTYMCAGNYSVNVTVTDDKCGNKTCNTLVTIIVPKPKLINPELNETVLNRWVTFNWTDIGCVNYTLEVWQKDGAKEKVLLVETGDNFWSGWIMDNDKYKWQVTATDSCGHSAVSDLSYFEVQDTYLNVSVDAPVAGDSFAGGSTTTIIWSTIRNDSFAGFGATGDEEIEVALSYSLNSGTSWTSIAIGQDATGSLAWIVPTENSANCLIKAVASDGYGNEGVGIGGPFSIVTADTVDPTITVDSPNGGESYAGGDSQTIGWTASDDVGVTSVNLYLSSNGGVDWAVVALDEPDDSTYTWKVPAINSVQCLVKAVAFDAAGNSAEDTSNEVFTITTAAPDVKAPVVTVNRPVGGETFAGGSQEFILWSATDDVTAQGDIGILLYYKVGTGSWIEITAFDGINDGEYKWDVPEINSDQCLVKVVATDKASNVGSDVSDNEFAIITGVVVSISDTAVSAGTSVIVPININGVTDLASVDIWLTYDKDVVTVGNVTAGTLGAITVSVDNTNGVTKINRLSGTGNTGDFVFANVELQAVGSAGEASALDLDVKEMVDSNGDPITRSVEDGVFTIMALMEGDVTLNSHVTIGDAMFIAQWALTLRTLSADQLECADTYDDGTVGMGDAMHIAQWLVDPDGTLLVLTVPLWESPGDDHMLYPVS